MVRSSSCWVNSFPNKNLSECSYHYLYNLKVQGTFFIGKAFIYMLIRYWLWLKWLINVLFAMKKNPLPDWKSHLGSCGGRTEMKQGWNAIAVIYNWASFLGLEDSWPDIHYLAWKERQPDKIVWTKRSPVWFSKHSTGVSPTGCKFVSFILTNLDLHQYF